MTENRKTLVFVGAAAVLTALAFLLAPSTPTPDEFADQGTPFFPDFTDPNTATTLEVVEFDEATGSTKPFKVTFENGRWVIPSHHNYPADAASQLAQTAAGVIEIARDDFRSDNAADYEALGVVDPLGEGAALSGRGKRVTIRGRNGEVLADLIFGKKVEGRDGFRYVRHPEEKRVYAAKVNIDISTRFQDWIDPDLLQLTRSDIERIEVNDYSINERTRSVDRRGQVVLTKGEDGGWKMAGLPSGQTVDSATVAAMLATLDSLKIVGVRPKPEGLSASLRQDEQQVSMSQADLLSLQGKGFYLSRDGQLMSNEGELLVHTRDGVAYTLRFGEVVYGSGLEVTAGTEDDQSPEPQGNAQNQYLFVTAEFDPKRLPEPKRPSDTSFVGKPDSLLSDADRQQRSLYNAWRAWQGNAERGRKKAQELNTRFADWYYVISHDSFRKLHKSRGDLVAAGKD
ncbi:MAG TPA: DUF4340 domain-containing protein [candidate division Zixibacteria bacterium]|nr:DUF4340 domain-containing protein [candidate division Zixibacteria bacterium]MDD4917612.1 DUF4340 domain-containing protein [candidate division Zixibacteria bacterium]MDM7972129.1 DUF4340 domain-containing protein [candidate division Zixibacteria bacterium]HOZ07219.1 DUF4340 domain-containing protein [candidate division Zixibacteria bacterium]HPC10541.1 DUF4340 domain-containing protein [candidate division Zixibacteria bacterium]